jgi:hypothetical protein
VRLSYEGGCFLVNPPAKAPSAFEPLELPLLSRSAADRMALLLEGLWQRQGRVAGFILFLDTRQKRWAWGVPRQRSGGESACWNVSRDDFPQLPPECVVAGSFQSRVFAGGEEPPDATPPADGLHFVLRIDPDARGIWSFVRMGGEPLAAMPGALIFDDFEDDLRNLTSRLTCI